ncbi:MAG: hypothetical protein M1839_007664 [Geoglossum umbratile]|nr:MAG: hypothetical protein M1839_007664 [Geoglossum umbratile]
MASRSNPNVPSKARRLAHPRRVKKNSQKVTKARGTKTQPKNIHVGGRVSSKKAKKLEKKQNFARKRAIEILMEETGEVKMTDAPRVTPKKDSGSNMASAQDAMEVDMVS